MAKNHYSIVILGGGSGGISVASKIHRESPNADICIVEPSDKHFYQPLWSIAGSGLANKNETVRNEKDVIPSGVDWIKESVLSVDPVQNKMSLTHNLELKYDFLIVATGLNLNWDKIEGLNGNLGKNGICSVYQFDQVDYTAETIQNFRGGKAVFVMPPTPIKCAGAPQKIMYLAENIFRDHGVRHKTEVIFATAGKAMFGIPLFANALDKIVKERNIHPHFQHKLVGVEADKKIAHFEMTDAEGKTSKTSINFDMLHVVPTMSAHSYVAESGLAFTEGEHKGWLAVNKETLQHVNFPNIFGIGDVTGIPNSKTGAAIRSQYPIVAKNLLSVMKGKKPSRKYNGYSSCPLITEIGKVMLAEFGYDGKLLPTFPLDPAVPRRSYWYLKRYVLPELYWRGMLSGRA